MQWIDECVMPQLRGRNSDAVRASLYALVRQLGDDDAATRNSSRIVVVDDDGECGGAFSVDVPPPSLAHSELRTALQIRMVEVCEEYAEYVVEQRARQQSVSLDFLDRELRLFRHALRASDVVLTLEQKPIAQADDLGNTVWDGALRCVHSCGRRRVIRLFSCRRNVSCRPIGARPVTGAQQARARTWQWRRLVRPRGGSARRATRCFN